MLRRLRALGRPGYSGSMQRARRGRWIGSTLALGALTLTVLGSPTLGSSASNTTTTTVVTAARVATPPLAWPGQGSGAVAIPGLSVAVASAAQPEVPIASITKLMTVWVALHRRPLRGGQLGPCLVVTPAEVAQYREQVATGQSTVKITAGLRLCENIILRGLLVHSAADYAHLLVALTGWSQATFVRIMNRDAAILGLTHTHYDEPTGIDARDRSTAFDQATLAVDLLAAEPVVRSIVRLPAIHLPVAGWQGSFTPDVGQGGVVGVKSGYTPAAGGCDVMAVTFEARGRVLTIYSVVLGQQGADPLVEAGASALALARSAWASVRTLAASGFTWVGPSRDVLTVPPWSPIVPPPTTTTTTTSTTTTTVATTTSTTTTTVATTTSTTTATP